RSATGPHFHLPSAPGLELRPGVLFSPGACGMVAVRPGRSSRADYARRTRRNPETGQVPGHARRALRGCSLRADQSDTALAAGRRGNTLQEKITDLAFVD